MSSKRSRSASLASLRTLAALALSASIFAGCNCGRAPTLQRSGVCTTGETQTCGPQDVGECKHGTQTCTGKNEWGPCDGAVYPTAETCDGKDNDCDGKVDNMPDAGASPLVQSCYPGPAGTQDVGACKAGTQTCTNGAWAACVGAVTPTAETCNGIDDDCDGNIDNQVGSTAVLTQGCYDGPASTRGVGACKDGSQSCQGGAWTACAGSVTPTNESCNNVDDDCNGQVDDNIAPQSCYDGPSGTQNVGTCKGGFSYCSAGVFGACTGEVVPAAQDACDGLDETCDGTVNGGCPCTPGTSVSCYGGPSGTIGVGPCHAGTQLCGPDGGYEPCAGDVRPTAEACNNVDDDCDGHVDNQPGTASSPLSQSCYDGPANTVNVGVCHAGSQTCASGAWGACQNEVVPSNEICDGRDNDCNGSVDNGNPGGGGSCNINGLKGLCATGVLACSDGGIVCAQTTFPTTETCDGRDEDCDGVADDWPDGGPITIFPCYTFDAGTPGVGVCKAGYQVCNGGTFGACTGEVGPSVETCDGKDNDCNGAVDDFDAGSSCTVPGKLGPCAIGAPLCAGTSGMTCVQITFPTTESCNGIDDDCDGTVDNVTGTTNPITQSCWTGSVLNRNVGICHDGTQACSGASWGACTGEQLPQAEVCNGKDDNCNGQVDEGIDAGSATCSTGLFAPCDVGHLACGVDGGSICVQNFTGDAGDGDLDGYSKCVDCNDNNAAVHPGATEVCDGIDNNCNGQVDEGFDSDKDCYTTCGTQYARRTKFSDAGCDYVDMVDGGLTDPGKVDCNDTDANIHPDIGCDCGAYNPSTNTCGTTADGKDNNCNGKVDETCSCSNVDNDHDGFTPCQGDCNDNDPTVYPGAPELCDGKDNDCNPLTVDNCDVGQPCGFDGGADTCKSRYICATDVKTGVASCGDFCNYSSVGAGVGDGCLNGTACGANMIVSDNDHVCVPASGQGTGAAGSTCTANSNCRSNQCNTTLGVCTDLCGNDSYCGTSASCVFEDFPASPGVTYSEVYGGYCWPNTSPLGTATQGQACSTRPSGTHCKAGSLACFTDTGSTSASCHQICCKQSDCGSGTYCGQGPSKPVGAQIGLATLPDGGNQNYSVDTGVPACLTKLSGQGTRISGQACTTSSQCASDMCDAKLKVCVDFCCNDSSCPSTFTCEFTWLIKANGDAEQARLCVAAPTQPYYKVAP